MIVNSFVTTGIILLIVGFVLFLLSSAASEMIKKDSKYSISGNILVIAGSIVFITGLVFLFIGLSRPPPPVVHQEGDENIE